MSVLPGSASRQGPVMVSFRAERGIWRGGAEPPIAQVPPLRIRRLDEGNSLRPAPRLDLLFSSKRRLNICRGLVVNEDAYVVLLSEPFDQFLFVLVETAFQVVGHSRVEGARSVRHDVNVIRCHHPLPRFLSSFARSE